MISAIDKKRGKEGGIERLVNTEDSSFRYDAYCLGHGEENAALLMSRS